LTISPLAKLDNIFDIAYIVIMAKSDEQVFPVKKLVRLTTDLAERIKAYRHEQRISSENEAVRQLLELGLKAAADSKPVSQS
jgi:hypothetical protein